MKIRPQDHKFFEADKKKYVVDLFIYDISNSMG